MTPQETRRAKSATIVPRARWSCFSVLQGTTKTKPRRLRAFFVLRRTTATRLVWKPPRPAKMGFTAPKALQTTTSSGVQLALTT